MSDLLGSSLLLRKSSKFLKYHWFDYFKFLWCALNYKCLYLSLYASYSWFFYLTGRRSNIAFVVKASGESSESSTSLTVFKSVQSVVSFSYHSYPSCLFFKKDTNCYLIFCLVFDIWTVGYTWGPVGTNWFGICSCSSTLGINKFDSGNLHQSCIMLEPNTPL
jgi:hypothetical protein